MWVKKPMAVVACVLLVAACADQRAPSKKSHAPSVPRQSIPDSPVGMRTGSTPGATTGGRHGQSAGSTASASGRPPAVSTRTSTAQNRTSSGSTQVVPASSVHPIRHSAAHAPTNLSCPARADGQSGGRWRQAIHLDSPGTTHEYPDQSVRVHACATSGLPVSLALGSGAINCLLQGDLVEATDVPASCTVVASQAGDRTFAPATAVSAGYRVALQSVIGAWGSPPAGSTVSLANGLTVSVVISSHGSFDIGELALQSADDSVCSTVVVGRVNGNGTATTTVNVPLHTTGTCTLTMSIVGAELNAVNRTPQPRSYHVGA